MNQKHLQSQQQNSKTIMELNTFQVNMLKIREQSRFLSVLLFILNSNLPTEHIKILVLSTYLFKVSSISFNLLTSSIFINFEQVFSRRDNNHQMFNLFSPVLHFI